MTRSVHTHSLTGQKPSQGYPENTIAHQKGVRTHSRIYPEKNGHSPRRWGLSIPGSFLRWRTNVREKFPIITLLLQKDCSKGVFSRGPIYSLFESELWSYSGMIQKLLWVKAPHWLSGPIGPYLLTEGSHLSCSSTQGVYVTEAPCSGEHMMVGTWSGV